MSSSLEDWVYENFVTIKITPASTLIALARKWIIRKIM